MLISPLTLILSLTPLTLAQYGDSPPAEKQSTSSITPSPSPTAATVSGKLHKITVGANNALVFSPSSLTASIGDSIEWHFYPSTHSVVQASFDTPCAPSISGTGFASGGFSTTGTGVENVNVFRVLVNSTEPLWYYCGFPGHCQGGMVGVVNPPANETLSQFLEKAKTATSKQALPGVRGGVVGAAAVEASTSASGTGSSPSASATKSGGVEVRGRVAWGLWVATGLTAGGVGWLIV